MPIRPHHLRRIPYWKLGPGTIRLVRAYPLLPGRYTAVALDTVGVKVDTPTLLRIDPELLRHAEEAYLEAAYDVSGTTTGAFEVRLRDVTAAKDVAKITVSYGTSSKRARSGDILGELTAGNEVGAQFAVTSAAAAGETGDLIDARLLVVAYIS